MREKEMEVKRQGGQRKREEIMVIVSSSHVLFRRSERRDSVRNVETIGYFEL